MNTAFSKHLFAEVNDIHGKLIQVIEKYKVAYELLIEKAISKAAGARGYDPNYKPEDDFKRVKNTIADEFAAVFTELIQKKIKITNLNVIWQENKFTTATELDKNGDHVELANKEEIKTKDEIDAALLNVTEVFNELIDRYKIDQNFINRDVVTPFDGDMTKHDRRLWIDRLTAVLLIALIAGAAVGIYLAWPSLIGLGTIATSSTVFSASAFVSLPTLLFIKTLNGSFTPVDVTSKLLDMILSQQVDKAMELFKKTDSRELGELFLVWAGFMHNINSVKDANLMRNALPDLNTVKLGFLATLKRRFSAVNKDTQAIDGNNDNNQETQNDHVPLTILKQENADKNEEIKPDKYAQQLIDLQFKQDRAALSTNKVYLHLLLGRATNWNVAKMIHFMYRFDDQTFEYYINPELIKNTPAYNSYNAASSNIKRIWDNILYLDQELKSNIKLKQDIEHGVKFLPDLALVFHIMKELSKNVGTQKIAQATQTV
jgi:hypothetical protein